VPGPHFASDDPRLAWSLPLDSRLHFALNCGGRSCPPIRSYSAEKLDLATCVFLVATVEVGENSDEVWLSRILSWYRGDFGGREGVLDFLIRYLPAGERRDFYNHAARRCNYAIGSMTGSSMARDAGHPSDQAVTSSAEA
jgi:hypothetical protein